MKQYEIIEDTIKYLVENSVEQPNLEFLAKRASMSPSHFQKLFSSLVGLSPKKFLEFITVENAKAILDKSKPLLEATYESGLSSSGRLHDLFINFEAVTPGEYKNKGLNTEIFYGFHISAFGEVLLTVTERGINGFYFLTGNDQNSLLLSLKNKWSNARFIEDYKLTASFFDLIFKPVKSKKKLTVIVSGTNFQVKVWQALINIPLGNLATYEDIAHLIGKPKAIRAAGTAIGQNPVSYLIPCHRVIRKTGITGNYGGGVFRKKILLANEHSEMLSLQKYQ